MCVYKPGSTSIQRTKTKIEIEAQCSATCLETRYSSIMCVAPIYWEMIIISAKGSSVAAKEIARC
jgi:hypothetical protein